MGRLIDADAITGISTHQTNNFDYDKGYTDGAVRVLKAIEHAPTIDAIPVEWIKKYDDVFDNIMPISRMLIDWQLEGKNDD